MILVFDTETTGLYMQKKPVEDDSQPDMVQLAAALYEDSGALVEEFETLVIPERDIHPKAFNAHGISRIKALERGIPPGSALNKLQAMAKAANILVGHNISFDVGVVAVAAHRQRHSFNPYEKPHHCTMRACTPILKLPPTPKMIRAGFRTHKSPTLTECVQYFFNTDLSGAHDALVDVRACAKVYFHVKEHYYVNGN